MTFLRSISIILLLSICSCLGAQSISWTTISVQGRLTGCSIPSEGRVEQTLGTIEKGKYLSPSGNVYHSGIVSKVAREVLCVQDSMEVLRHVLGNSPRVLAVGEMECELADLVADCILDKARCIFGADSVDISLYNLGGIRTDLPKGPVTVDNICSMLPFANNICLVRVDGRTLRGLFENLVSNGLQAFGGAKIKIVDGRLSSLLVAGKPVEDEREYGIASINFLLDGGDGIFLSRGAHSILQSAVTPAEALLEYAQSRGSQGLPITCDMDGRVACEVVDASDMGASDMVKDTTSKK